MENIIKKIFLTIMILLALYKVTSYSQTVSEFTGVHEEFNKEGKTFEIIESYLSEPEVSNGLATITFRIYKHGEVNLNVFDAQGGKIQTLVEGEMEPGSYSVFFKANENIAPGEYYYEMDVDGVQHKSKMFTTKFTE